ncbi:hypothetical protein [Nostoc sp.]|uniref:hypothetical protein n=1 Tax=Nostoc sp. TaxID=1180 RepID=UPI002FF875B2
MKLLKNLFSVGAMFTIYNGFSLKEAANLKNLKKFSVFSFVSLISSVSFLFPTDAKAETRTYKLLANNGQGIVIPVSQGDVIKINASGQVHTHPGGTVAGCDIWTQPSGLKNCIYVSQRPELDGLPFMALVGILNGEKIYIGSNKTIQCDSDGELVLLVNDWVYDDNTGSLKVKVKN